MFGNKYKQENEILRNTISKMSIEVKYLQAQLAKYESIKIQTDNFNKLDDMVYDKKIELDELKKMIEVKEVELSGIEKEIIGANKLNLEQMLGIYQPDFKYDASDEYKERLSENIKYQKISIKDGNAVILPIRGSLSFNGNKNSGNTIINTVGDLTLIAFNSYCNEIIDKAKAYNYYKYSSMISSKANKLNKMSSKLNIYISEQYVSLKIEQLEIQLMYKEAIEKEKEEKRIQREILKEQESVDKELEREKSKLYSEKEKYETMISKEKDDEKLYNLHTALNKVNQCIKNNEYRLKNKKSGFLYAISNPDMEDGMIKIGCTRRDNVDTRITELSNASHAFKFNIHCSVFSSDVFELEANMHRYFKDRQVNLANYRKEFFYVDCNEVKEALAHFGYKVNMNYNPTNEQFLLSESMRKTQ